MQNSNLLIKILAIMTFFIPNNFYGAARINKTVSHELDIPINIDYLHNSITNNNISGVRLALERGVNVNLPDGIGNTPLIRAVLLNNEAIVDLLLKRKEIDIDHQNAQGDTAAIIACRQGNIRIINMLTIRGANLTLVNKQGIRFAQEYNLFLKREKEQKEAENEKSAKLKVAQEKKNKENARKAIEIKEEKKEEKEGKEEKVNTFENQDFLNNQYLEAIQAGDIKRVNESLEMNADLFAKDAVSGLNPLALSVLSNNMEMLEHISKLMVNYQLNVFGDNGDIDENDANLLIDYGQQAIDLAIEMEKLFAINILTGPGRFPCNLTAYRNYKKLKDKIIFQFKMRLNKNNFSIYEIINYLEDIKKELKGTNELLELNSVDRKETIGKMQKMENELESLKKHIDLYNYIMSEQQDVTAELFEYFLSNKNQIEQIVHYFGTLTTYLKSLKDDLVKVNSLKSVLYDEVDTNECCIDVLHNLIRNICSNDRVRLTKEFKSQHEVNELLFEALARFDYDAVKNLVEQGNADVNLRLSWTPLTWLIYNAKNYEIASEEMFEILKISNYLTEKGADINLKDKMGVTPLIIALTTGNMPIISSLLRNQLHSVNLNLTNPFGQTPLMMLITAESAFNKEEDLWKLIEFFVARSDINVVDLNGDSALMYVGLKLVESIKQKTKFNDNFWRKVVNLLLINNADIKANKSGFTFIGMLQELELDKYLEEILSEVKIYFDELKVVLEGSKSPFPIVLSNICNSYLPRQIDKEKKKIEHLSIENLYLMIGVFSDANGQLISAADLENNINE